MIQLCWKTVWQFLTKPNLLFPYDSATGQLGIYPKELKACMQTKNCAQMFIAAYSSLPKFGSNQEVLPKWVDKLGHPHKVYYLELKRNEVSGRV